MPCSEMLRRLALIRPDVSEGLSAAIIRVTRIDELGSTLAVSSSLILVTLMMEALSFSEKSVLQEPHCVTSQKTTLFET
jgi:hypothetical protein